MHRRQAIHSLLGGSALMPALLGELLADGAPAPASASGAHFPAAPRTSSSST